MAVATRRDPATLSRIERWLAGLPPTVDRAVAIRELVRSLPAADRDNLRYAWTQMWARPAQQLPLELALWRLWFIRAGRGFGKTRTGAEAVRRLRAQGKARAVLLIAPTAAEARDVMIESPESGLLVVHPRDTRPRYEPSKRLLTWPDGALGYVRSAEEPDAIRGINSEVVWGDEPASWKSGRAAWDNALLGNRIGDPHQILTGTPRPLPWLRELERAPTTHVTTGSTYENIANLAPAFIELVVARFEGTHQGAQELHGLYAEDVKGALWRLATIEANRIPFTDETLGLNGWDNLDPWGWLAGQLTLERRLAAGLGPYRPRPDRRPWVVWVGVDPPGETAECGIVVGTAPRNGVGHQDHAVILDDMSVAGPPEVWGAQVIEAVHKWRADGVVVESNQGGDMVRSTIHAADPDVVVEKVRAKESKGNRAAPVSVLYAKGWVHHLGVLAALEGQMTSWVPNPEDGEKKSKSPDRLDAAVHLVTKLLRIPDVSGHKAEVASADQYR